jgi:hypothetical protein
MKKSIPIFLISLFLIGGCATPQPEIRYYQSYNRPPEFESYIQGDGYKLWYDKELHSQFIELEKGSTEWEALQKSVGTHSLDHVFYNRESGVGCMITKNRYKISYDKILNNAKKLSATALIKSDQRMVNNTPVLYIRFLNKMDGNNVILSTYYINSDSGLLTLTIACPKDSYGEYRKMIQDALNGIEVN